MPRNARYVPAEGAKLSENARRRVSKLFTESGGGKYMGGSRSRSARTRQQEREDGTIGARGWDNKRGGQDNRSVRTGQQEREDKTIGARGQDNRRGGRDNRSARTGQQVGEDGTIGGARGHKKRGLPEESPAVSTPKRDILEPVS